MLVSTVALGVEAFLACPPVALGIAALAVIVRG
jgi:hypothetical protein